MPKKTSVHNKLVVYPIFADRVRNEAWAGPHRYRLEGIVHALLHIRIIGNSVKNTENAKRAHSPAQRAGLSE